MSLGFSHHGVGREHTTFASTVFVVCGSPRSSRPSLLNLCLQLSERRVAGGGSLPSLEQQCFLPYCDAHGWECGFPGCPVCSHSNHDALLLFSISPFTRCFYNCHLRHPLDGFGVWHYRQYPNVQAKETEAPRTQGVASSYYGVSEDMNPGCGLPRSGFSVKPLLP